MATPFILKKKKKEGKERRGDGAGMREQLPSLCRRDKEDGCAFNVVEDGLEFVLVRRGAAWQVLVRQVPSYPGLVR